MNTMALVEFHILISRTCPFRFKGYLVGIFHFHFYSNFKRTFCKQTVDSLTSCCVLWRLIWVCIGCICPTKRTLGLYGLSSFVSLN